MVPNVFEVKIRKIMYIMKIDSGKLLVSPN